MKYLLLTAASLFVLSSCMDSPDMPEPINYHDLTITTTTTPKEIKLGDISTSKITCLLPNSCSIFAGFEVRETGGNTVEVRAKGRDKSSDASACAQVITPIDTVLKLKPMITGKIILKFYNKADLLKSDTLDVTN